jgi:basic amino acid/polyamine antiporter, APA family
LAPRESTAHFNSILVPVDGSNASLQAVALACDIARKNKGIVYVVHVIEVKRTLPLDASLDSEAAAGEEILARAEEVAREQKLDLRSEIIQAREASHAIVDEAMARSVDLVILGMEYQQPFGEFQLGRLIEHVMKSAPCEVWVCRHPARG